MRGTSFKDPDVEPLRSEAASSKQCFTEYSFQTFALGGAVLAASLAAVQGYPYAAYIPLPMIFLFMTVCRIGVFKYATANRNLGYELHLSRTRRIEQAGLPSKWEPRMRQIDWEEALRAWRVVQPTLFRMIYSTPQDSSLSRRCGAIFK